MEIPGAKDYGHYKAIRCPYHDDNKPSMLVFEKYAVCLACGARVGILKLLRDLQLQAPYIREEADRVAVLSLRNPANLYLESLRHTDDPAFKHYIQQRNIVSASACFRLGFLPESGHVVIPIYDFNQVARGIFVRAIYNNNYVRYQCKSDIPISFYQNPFTALNVWFVTFGAFDALSVWECGYHALTPMSKYPSKRAIEALAEFCTKNDAVLYFIPDLGEEHEAFQFANAIGVRAVVRRLKYLEGMKDPNDLHVKNILKPQLVEVLPSWLH